ncbi:MAG TPA: carboxylesterase family protein [Acetobacteraceae bacterium]|nr:carboxylesterase family protein [Acetobacteraceae bacterium]
MMTRTAIHVHKRVFRFFVGRVISSVVALLALGLGAPAFATTPSVAVEQGVLSGVAVGSVDEFLGVRYATPPVGDLRWRPPQPVSRGHQQLDATHFGNYCAQGTSPWGTPSTSEDCLFLNIYAPAATSGPQRWERKLPVMVWIHGGGFTAGAGAAYDPTALVREGNVIVVTINYRLGALGLFAHPALDAENHLIANYALMDQQLALKWLQRNIPGFGGDPHNITIFGESAGGISIYAHLVSRLASGLFQKAIIESGAPDYITLQQSESDGVTLAGKVGCNQGTQQQIAACLRAVPVAELLSNQATETGAIIDGTLLTEPLADALAQGRFNQVPIMNGTNHDEFRLVIAFSYDLAGAPLQASGYQAALDGFGSFLPGTGYPTSDVPAIIQQYPLSAYSSPDLAAAQVITDGTISCPAFEMDKLMAARVPVWAYQFSDENAPSIVAPPVSFPYGAAHFSELQYLFNMSALTIPGTPALTPAQLGLATRMKRYWTAFATNGDPNSVKDVPFWRNFDQMQRYPMQSLDEPRPRPTFQFAQDHQCDFWHALRPLTGPGAQVGE